MSQLEDRHLLSSGFSSSSASSSLKRPFGAGAKKPTSWRHPGGTVSETEDGEFSEGEKYEQETPRIECSSFSFSSIFKAKPGELLNSSRSPTRGLKDKMLHLLKDGGIPNKKISRDHSRSSSSSSKIIFEEDPNCLEDSSKFKTKGLSSLSLPVQSGLSVEDKHTRRHQNKIHELEIANHGVMNDYAEIIDKLTDSGFLSKEIKIAEIVEVGFDDELHKDILFSPQNREDFAELSEVSELISFERLGSSSQWPSPSYYPILDDDEDEEDEETNKIELIVQDYSLPSIPQDTHSYRKWSESPRGTSYFNEKKKNPSEGSLSSSDDIDFRVSDKKKSNFEFELSDERLEWDILDENRKGFISYSFENPYFEDEDEIRHPRDESERNSVSSNSPLRTHQSAPITELEKDFKSNCRLLRGRHPLRGPFGQMLDAQMSKSDISRRSNDISKESLESVSDDSNTIIHSRSLSSPSKLLFSSPPINESKNFADFSTDKLTVHQELLVSRNPRKDSIGPSLGISGINSTMATTFRPLRDTRTMIVKELYNVEKSYVESLQFLMNKYMAPLKSSEKSHLIASVMVDEIFFQIPSILNHHLLFLHDLKIRLEDWSSDKTIGDWFLDCFRKSSVVETYTEFIRNVKRADETIRIAIRSNPAFERFLQDMRIEQKEERLSLADLLAKPHQRIPRYRLLIQRLIEHTSTSHPDFPILRIAEKEIHSLALQINAIQRENNEQESREQILRSLELSIIGLSPNDLGSPTRRLLQYDLVTMTNGPWTRKDRTIFLFSDLLVITSISRRAARDVKRATANVSNLTSLLENCRHKLWMYISLDDVEISKVKEEIYKKIQKENNEIEKDLNTLRLINDASSKLHCPHKDLDDISRTLVTTLSRQLSERQNAEVQQSQYLELRVFTSYENENISLIFSSSQARKRWEELFNQVKQKLIQRDEGKIQPEFLNRIPIRKTRSGLQFTCAAPTLGMIHKLKDVWVCNSDGYVGQVCVLSLLPVPSVVCCNGVCNARILSIVSVPSILKACDENLRTASPRLTTEDSSSTDSEDESDEMGSERKMSNESLKNTDNVQTTMWLGTEDGHIHVYNCTDNIRIKKNKEKFLHTSPVLSLIYFDNRVFVSLGNGELIMYLRYECGTWDKLGAKTLLLGSSDSPVHKMLIVENQVWCVTGNEIKIIDPYHLEILSSFSVDEDAKFCISLLCHYGDAVWIASSHSPTVKAFHIHQMSYLCEVCVNTTVNSVLSGCDDIIRQHKAACLRVTALLICKDILWIGTSAGVIVTMHLPVFTQDGKTPILSSLLGIFHGHSGHVRFLTCVEMTPEFNRTPFGKNHGRFSIRSKDGAHNSNGYCSKMLVISGGDGYEDFTNVNHADLIGRDDSTNHLLLWQI